MSVAKRSPLPAPEDHEAIIRCLMTAAIRLNADPSRVSACWETLAAASGVDIDIIRQHLIGPDPMTALARHQIELNGHRSDAALAGIEDPAVRLAISLRLCVRRGHDNPSRTLFCIRYGLGSRYAIEPAWSRLDRCLRTGIATGRFTIQESQVESAISVILPVMSSATHLVARQTYDWEEAGRNTARFVLKALGIYQSEAAGLVRMPLPAVPAILLGEEAGNERRKPDDTSQPPHVMFPDGF